MKNVKKFEDYNLNEDVQEDDLDTKPGFYDEEADKLPRIDKTWSDDSGVSFNDVKSFERLKCNDCGSTTFEVLFQIPAEYQLVAQCTKCKKYFIPYTG